MSREAYNLLKAFVELAYDERWVTTENGHRVLLSDEGTVEAGFGGKFTGEKIGKVGSGKSKKSSDPDDATIAKWAAETKADNAARKAANTPEAKAKAAKEKADKEYAEYFRGLSSQEKRTEAALQQRMSGKKSSAVPAKPKQDNYKPGGAREKLYEKWSAQKRAQNAEQKYANSPEGKAKAAKAKADKEYADYFRGLSSQEKRTEAALQQRMAKRR